MRHHHPQQADDGREEVLRYLAEAGYDLSWQRLSPGQLPMRDSTKIKTVRMYVWNANASTTLNPKQQQTQDYFEIVSSTT